LVLKESSVPQSFYPTPEEPKTLLGSSGSPPDVVRTHPGKGKVAQEGHMSFHVAALLYFCLHDRLFPQTIGWNSIKPYDDLDIHNIGIMSPMLKNGGPG
jgi:hypothetical protein